MFIPLHSKREPNMCASSSSSSSSSSLSLPLYETASSSERRLRPRHALHPPARLCDEVSPPRKRHRKAAGKKEAVRGGVVRRRVWSEEVVRRGGIMSEEMWTDVMSFASGMEIERLLYQDPPSAVMGVVGPRLAWRMCNSLVACMPLHTAHLTFPGGHGAAWNRDYLQTTVTACSPRHLVTHMPFLAQNAGIASLHDLLVETGAAKELRGISVSSSSDLGGVVAHLDEYPNLHSIDASFWSFAMEMMASEDSMNPDAWVAGVTASKTLRHAVVPDGALRRRAEEEVSPQLVSLHLLGDNPSEDAVRWVCNVLGGDPARYRAGTSVRMTLGRDAAGHVCRVMRAASKFADLTVRPRTSATLHDVSAVAGLRVLSIDPGMWYRELLACRAFPALESLALRLQHGSQLSVNRVHTIPAAHFPALRVLRVQADEFGKPHAALVRALVAAAGPRLRAFAIANKYPKEGEADLQRDLLAALLPTAEDLYVALRPHACARPHACFGARAPAAPRLRTLYAPMYTPDPVEDVVAFVRTKAPQLRTLGIPRVLVHVGETILHKDGSTVLVTPQPDAFPVDPDLHMAY